MDWLLRHISTLVFVVVAISAVRAALRAKGAKAEHDAGADESAEQRRVREIQERIRRTIAERRGGLAPSSPPPLMQPASRPMTEPRAGVPPIDPFGGGELGGAPIGKMLGEMQRRRAEAQRWELSPLVRDDRAVLERQQQLAEKMRALEEARAAAQRRAAQLAVATKEEAETSGAVRTLARGNLLLDLREPESLRRAFVLREVLGPPVALR